MKAVGSFEAKKVPSHPKAETSDVQNVDFARTREERGSGLRIGRCRDAKPPGGDLRGADASGVA